jgi:Tol biopolymer transport system component/predicted Ser/Thr protein kinase
MIGRTLSHYRILEKLGAGGMGEVYRARDEKLGRDVAVKVLPAGLLAGEAARARFRKEAEALSRLSHPHVATLFDFDSEGGVDFLVMERVEGKTLQEAVREGPLSEKEIVRLGSQLARGLQAAHEHGVVHRDLKPGNLALTSDGLLKVLDFGLARLERLTVPEVGEVTASTDTAVGHVVGTPAYMAPEQLRGKGVDARTDVYGAGACLYEIATGRRPFGAKSGVELTDAVLHEAPVAPRSVSGAVSPGLEAVILKCLDKDPDLRYQTAKELLVDLERLHVSATSGAASGPVAVAEADRRRRRRHMALAVAAILVVGVAVGLWLLRPPRPPRITNARPLTGGMDGLSIDRGWATDGSRLYYLVGGRSKAAVYEVPVTGGEPAPVPIALPVPYNQSICGYLARESALLMMGSELDNPADTQKGWALWAAPVPAGAPSRLGNLEAFGATPSPDGTMLALSQRGARLAVVRRDGTLVREWPPFPSQPVGLAWSPDGRRLRFHAVGPDQRRSWVWEVSARGGELRALWPGRGGRWTPDGRYYVFDRSDEVEARNDIYAVREPVLRWLAPSQPLRLTFGPLSFTDVGPSPDGKHVFAWGTFDRGELLRYDAKSGRFGKYLEGASVYYGDASRDGQWLTWVSYPDGALWRGRPDGSDRLKLTGPGWGVFLPRWSPDGTRILFAGRAPEERPLSIFTVSREGGEPELLARSRTQLGLWDPCWLPDGQTILYSHSGYSAPEDLGIYRLDLRTHAVSILPGTERMQYPKCSPRGDILAMEKPAQGMAQPPYWAFFVDRGRWERLGFMPIGHPNWSRDGQSFTGLNDATRRIERWSRATGRLEAVADVSDIPLLTWVVVPWMGLAADGSPLVVRDRSTRDLYALDWEAP